MVPTKQVYFSTVIKSIFLTLCDNKKLWTFFHFTDDISTLLIEWTSTFTWNIDALTTCITFVYYEAKF